MLLAKSINKDDENIPFQIDSMINTSKNGEIKFYREVDELKSLIKNHVRNTARGQHTKQVEHFDKQNSRGRKKNKRRPRFLV